MIYEVWRCFGDVGFGAAFPSAKSLHPRSSGARFGHRAAGRDGLPRWPSNWNGHGSRHGSMDSNVK